jgi:hypothetical protein
MTRDFLTTLKDEITREAKLTKWRRNRQELLARVAMMYDTRGDAFTMKLESLLESSHKLPAYNMVEMMKHITNN